MSELPKDTYLGKKVKDKVTGMTGTVVAEYHYLYGCVRCAVQGPVDKDGKAPDWQTFDKPQLEVLGEGVKVDLNPEVRTKGGPAPAIPDHKPSGEK